MGCGQHLLEWAVEPHQHRAPGAQPEQPGGIGRAKIVRGNEQVCAACRVVELALGARAQGAALYLMARMLQRVAQLLGDGEHTARGGIFLQQQGAERGGGHGA